jgi:uncharacterized protein (TIGR02594 family)
MVQASPLDMAKTVLGYTEGKDRAALIDYMKTGGQNIDPATRAWCASFINASLEKAGYSGTGSDLARSFLEWGNAVEPGNIQPGDIGVYPRGSDPTYGHAGIVESYDPKTGQVTMISGNAGDEGAVQRGQYSLKEALGFRRAQMDAEMKAAGYTPEQRRNAIAAIESAGSGDYSAMGPTTKAGDRAYGRYQVMGRNVGPWAEQYLKKAGVTADQFLKDPALQDQLFDAVYGDYVAKHGERGAASMWFTGRPDEPNVTDVNGKLTGKTYADMYMEQLGRSPTTVRHPPNATVGAPDAAPADAGGNPYLDALKNKPEEKKKNAWEMFGEGIGDAAGAMAKAGQGFGYNITPQPGPARVSVAPVPSTDPQAAEIRRQQLAYAMQRLNSGGLV